MLFLKGIPFFSIFLLLAQGSIPPFQSTAEARQILTSFQKKEALREALFKAYLEADNKEAASYLGLAMAMPGSEYADIVKDVRGRFPKEKLMLKNREIFIDGKPSGLKVKTYLPLQLSMGAKVWTEEAGMSPRDTYLSLRKFFAEGDKKHSYLLDQLFPNAYALENNRPVVGGILGSIGGGIAGYMSSLVVICAFTPPGEAAILLGGTVAGVIGGASYLYRSFSERDREAARVALQKSLDGKVQVNCSKKSISLSFEKGEVNSLTFKPGGTKFLINFRDGQSRTVPIETTSLAALMDSCSNQSEAQALEARINTAFSRARDLASQRDPSVKDQRGESSPPAGESSGVSSPR